MSTFTLQGNLKVPNGGHIGSVGDDDAITIDSDGNIGIGANNPQQKLDIRGGFLGVRSASEATDSVIYIGAPFNQETNVAYKAAIFFQANATEQGWSTGTLHICNREAINDNSNNAGTDDARISIKPNGDVGIGTKNPQNKLDIDGGATLIKLKNTDTPDSRCTILFDTDNGDWELGARGSNGNPDDTFYIYNGNYAMIIDKDRNVGFGTTDPKGKLDIRGNTYIQHGGNESNFLSCYTQNETDNIGKFIFRWDEGGNNNDYNVQVIMYRSQDNKLVDGVVGFFENNDDNGSFTFTGQHRSLMNKNDYTVESIGLIVSSDGKYINMDNSLNPTIDETLPYCVLSDIDNDKRVYGVISNKEDTNEQRSAGAGFVKTIPKTNTNEERIFINSLGEGAIWVSNKNGPLENGDYITSTTIKGYGGKQTAQPNTLMNYTVGKITCDCDFNLEKIVKQKLKIITVTETLKRKVEEEVTESIEKNEISYDVTENKYVQTPVTEEVTTKQTVKDTYNLYDTEGNIIGTHDVEREESYDVTKTQIDYDENGDVQYEDDLDENGNQQMVYKYETRFLQEDGTLLVDEEDYDTRLANGEAVYIACFVGCTYHCG